MATNSYSSLCDDFYMDMHIYTELDLPVQRDTVLAFFERVQKQFPSMGRFYRRENNQYCLQEDCEAGRYRWISLEIDRIGSGVVNPANLEEAYCQDRLILELSPYMLSLSHLDISWLDVSFSMDFDCAGSHDEVIAEALLSKSAFSCFLDTPSVRLIGFSPTIAVALSADGCTQARISVESKTNPPEVRRTSVLEGPASAGGGIDEAISLSLTIRQYPNTTEKFDTLKSFEHQCRLAEELMVEKVIPNLVLPLTATIAQKRLT